jgi:F-box domain
MLKIIKMWLQKFFKQQTDPTKILPEHILESVLGYLSFEDLLRCSLVNKSWRNFIGNSEKCMEKFKFVVMEPYHGLIWKFTAADAENMVKNDRKYKHIELFISRNMTTDHLLLVASRKWKKVKICHHTFKTEIELTNFFGLIEPFVEELNLGHIKLVFRKEKELATANFQFPRLRKLKVTLCCTFIFSEIFKNVGNIEKLEIETGSVSCDDVNDVTKRAQALEVILINNVKIKTLSLYLRQIDFDGMFMDMRFLSRLKFKLESLKVKKFKRLEGANTNVVQAHNFGVFLTSQQKSMTSLIIYDCVGNNILETIINEMDKLKYLQFDDLGSYAKLEESIANVNFYKNESIETLVLNSQNSKYFEVQKTLIGTVPNLKTLKIGTVNQVILDTVIDKTPKLLNLKLDYFSAYLPPDRAVLHNLKEIVINLHYARNFKDQLRDFTNYTNFERVYLRAVKVFHEKNGDLY